MANKSSLTLWVDCLNVRLFDCSNNRTIEQSNNRILEYGLDRINKSVYLGSISERSLKELETFLRDQITQKGTTEDSLIILPVTAAQVQRLIVIGKNELDKDELAGEKHTLIL